MIVYRDEENKTNDYKVGKGKPPREHQFPKGKSGNPRGRPPKKTPNSIDAIGVLNSDVNVRIDGKNTKVTAFEASFRQISKRAVEGNLSSIRQFLNQCEKFELIGASEPEHCCGVVHAPKGVNFGEWLEEVTELVPDVEQ